MKRFLLMISLVWSLFCTITTAHADEEVRYSIESYVGHLQLQEDSQATFTQEITYQFQTGYHGQYVTLGSADPLPKGFKIHRNPEVEAYVDGEKREIRVEETDLEDGRQLKIYNARIVGGTVKIKHVQNRGFLPNAVLFFSALQKRIWILLFHPSKYSTLFRVKRGAGDEKLYAQQ